MTQLGAFHKSNIYIVRKSSRTYLSSNACRSPPRASGTRRSSIRSLPDFVLGAFIINFVDVWGGACDNDGSYAIWRLWITISVVLCGTMAISFVFIGYDSFLSILTTEFTLQFQILMRNYRGIVCTNFVFSLLVKKC